MRVGGGGVVEFEAVEAGVEADGEGEGLVGVVEGGELGTGTGAVGGGGWGVAEASREGGRGWLWGLDLLGFGGEDLQEKGGFAAVWIAEEEDGDCWGFLVVHGMFACFCWMDSHMPVGSPLWESMNYVISI